MQLDTCARPASQGGRRVADLTYTPELHPTLCALAGVPPAQTVETQSLVPLLEGRADGIRDSVCQVYKDVQRLVTDGRWKLIRYYRSRERPDAGTDGIQLFDLQADPWETRDLSAEPAHAGHVERLAAQLAAWQRQVEDPLDGVPVLPDPALGYPSRAGLGCSSSPDIFGPLN